MATRKINLTELKRMIRAEVKATLSEGSDPDLDKVVQVVTDLTSKDRGMFDFGNSLKKAFGAKNVTYFDIGNPAWLVKVRSGKKIAILNKKYVASGPDIVIVGEYAIGYLSKK